MAGGHKVTGLLVGAITNLWHSSLALESPSHSVVDTLGFPPAWVNTFESVALMAVEALSVLLDDWNVLLCGNHLCSVLKSGSICRLVLMNRKSES